MNRPSLTDPRHRLPDIHGEPTTVQADVTTVGTAHVYVATNLDKSVVAKVLGETWTEHDIEELGGM